MGIEHYLFRISQEEMTDFENDHRELLDYIGLMDAYGYRYKVDCFHHENDVLHRVVARLGEYYGYVQLEKFVQMKEDTFFIRFLPSQGYMVDLGKQGGWVFEIVDNIGRFYGYAALENFMHTKEDHFYIEDFAVAYLKPEKVRQAWNCFEEVTPYQFNRAFAASSDWRKYDYLDEESRDEFHGWRFVPMFALFKKAAEAGEGILYFTR